MSDASGASMPTNTTNTTTTIPDYARPYVEEMLGATGALTFDRDEQGNIQGFQPYQNYGGERTAQFSPLQQQSYEAAGALGTSPQIYAASDMAQRAGLAALNQGSYTGGQFQNQYNSGNVRDTQVRGFADPAGAAQYFAQNPDVGAAYKANSFGMSPEQFAQAHYQQHGMAEGRDAYTTQSNAERLMSPYMQSVVDVQQREAQRQADIAGTRQQAAATQSGAFGGSRDAIMRAEAARNLAMQKGDIQATGLQAAYQQAQSQFNADQGRELQSQTTNQGAQLQNAGNTAQYGQAAAQLGEQSRQYGAGLGLQNLQAGISAAGQLGQLGATQFQQDQGALQTQNTFGVQQQQQMQNILTQQYNDFLNQQKYPYQQMGYMSDMLRGLPMANTSSQIYGQPQSATSQLAGLAATAYGASKLAKGGQVKAKPRAKGGLQELAMAKMMEAA